MPPNQGGLSGELTIGGDGTFTLDYARLPVVGTLTVQLTSTAWNAAGQIVPKLRLANTSAAYFSTIYQSVDSASDVAAGTAITASGLIYIRLDGTVAALVVTGYVSGTMLVEYSWSAG